MMVPFSPPDISEAEIEEVVAALRSGWITTGPRTQLLGEKVAEYCGTPKAICLNSQTACAEMALRILGIGPGDEVITTAYTYTATAAVVCHVGAKLVLVDTLPDSLCINYDQLENAINEHTKAIIPVSIAGIPCDYDRLYDIVEKKRPLFDAQGPLQTSLGRVAILTDAAHALGTQWHGKREGALGDLTAFSFHAVKNLTTAEGGALTWKGFDGISDDEIYRQVSMLSLHGQTKSALDKTKLSAWEYDVLGTYYKCNLTDVAAAIGLAQLKRYEGMLARRREIIEKYDAALCPLGVHTLDHYTDEWVSSGHLYITNVPGITLEQRSEIIDKMAKEQIACNVHYKPLPLLTAYKNMGFDIHDYPNAYAQYCNAISLPLHTCLTDDQVDYVIENYTRILKEYLG